MANQLTTQTLDDAGNLTLPIKIWEKTIEDHDNLDGLKQLGPEDPTVVRILEAFGQVLDAATIDFTNLDQPNSALDPLLGRPTVELDTRMCGKPALEMLLRDGAMVLPILEYGRTLKHTEQFPLAEQEESILALRCIPRHLKPRSFVSLGADSVGSLACVHGTVVALSLPRLVCRQMMFKCTKCGNKFLHGVEDILLYPTACPGRCGSRFKGAQLVPVPKEAITEEIQYVRLQEMSSSTTDGVGGNKDRTGTGMARLIEVVLLGSLIDTVTAGDMVSATGFLGTKMGDRKRAQGTHQIVVKAMHIGPLAGSTSRQIQTSSSQANVLTTSSAADDRWAALNRRVAHANLSDPAPDYPNDRGAFPTTGWFRFIRDSLCPGIFGHEQVKEALVLALLGGSAKHGAMRSNIHCVIVGDPGMGKSQLLRAASNVSPRSAMVSANVSSTCGLTMTLSRDPNTGEATFEAGAVVHGDGGTTCIDEIDKGKSEHKALLEVMEQEALSMAKAGMVFTMPIHTTVLAAGNPVGGKFACEKPIGENVNMSSALLSRFDLVWLLKDVPASGLEQDIAHHVLSMHQRGKGGTRTAVAQRHGVATTAGDRAGGAVFSAAEFREYITLARERCNPVLTPGACVVLKQAYLSNREESCPSQGLQKSTTSKFSSVTARQLQSMIRLSEARAKIELRSQVTEADANYAVNVLLDCAATALPTEAEMLAAANFPRKKAGKRGNSQNDVMARVAEMIHHHLQDGVISEDKIKDIAMDEGWKWGLERVVPKMSNEYLILEAPGGKWKPRKP